jgi:hypothetical protein
MPNRADLQPNPPKATGPDLPGEAPAPKVVTNQGGNQSQSGVGNNASALVGKWNFKTPGGEIDYWYTFYDNENYKYEENDFEVFLREGKYEVSGNKLILTPGLFENERDELTFSVRANQLIITRDGTSSTFTRQN